MGNRCKYIITFLVILSFLCQSFSWAYGESKLAKDTELDNDKFIATSRVLSGLLKDMYRIDKNRKRATENDLNVLNDEIRPYNENLRLIYHPATRNFYLHSLKPRNGPGVVYRLGLREIRCDPFFGDRKPFHRGELGRFKLAIFTGPLSSRRPPAGSRHGVLTGLLALIQGFILIFMLLIPSPARSQTADPQWVVDMEEMIRLEQVTMQTDKYGAGLQYDSLGGGFVSGGIDTGWWGVEGTAGLGNPLYGLDEEGTGGIVSAYWRPADKVWLSYRAGLLPDYSPDSTYFGLVGVDTELWDVVHPYLHAGLLHRRSDGVSGQATGLLVDTGLDFSWRGIGGGFRLSGPLYFRPTAATVEDYRRVVGDLSLLRLRLGYDGRLWWVRGLAEAGGTESRLDSRLPSNRFSRFGGDAGLRFDLGEVDLALGGSGQWASPSFAENGRVVGGPSVALTWRDLSLRGGALFGPFARPYGEVLYRVMGGLEVFGGYSAVPPLYAPDFYDGPWDPRSLVAFGLRYNYGAAATQPVYPRDGYPAQTPSGVAMDRFAYGPFKPPERDLVDELNDAQDRFEKSLTGAVEEAGTVNKVHAILRKLLERLDPEGVSSLAAFGAFWDAYYKNPNLDFYWIYFIRDKVRPGSNEYRLWHESHGYSYGDILKRLLDRRYDVSDYNSLSLLIYEFNQLMNTIVEDGVDKGVLDNADTLFKSYMSRLGKIEPGGLEFTFTYYAASRLFYVLMTNGIYPGIDALTSLVEAYLMIPADSVGLNIGMVMPDEEVMQEVRPLSRGIMSEEPKMQVQGLLILELLLFEAGGVARFEAGTIDRVYEIFRGSVPSEGVDAFPELVPLVPPAEDSEYYLSIKAAAIALDWLIRIGRQIDEVDLDRFIWIYQTLPPNLQQKLKTDTLRGLLEPQPKKEGGITPKSGALRKHASLMPRLLFPMAAGFFLTGCNGTGVGVAAVIGILCLLVFAAVVFATALVRPEQVPEREERPERKYKPTGNKTIDDFLDEVYKERDKRTILALDTDIGDLRDPAMSLLATLERLNLGGITFIRTSGEKLRAKLDRIIGEDKDVNVVLVCKDTNKGRFDGLQNAYITSVDDSQRSGTYIPILKILTFSLKMADKTGIDEVRELYREITNQELTPHLYDEIINGLLSIVLPPSEPMDYDAQRREYESEKELLLSA